MHPRHVRAAAVVLCCALPAPHDARAVNLVPDPGFESYTTCPTAFGQLNATVWWDAPTTGTSDYFNTCVTGWPTFPVPGVPLSPFGYQWSNSGSGHAGLIPYSSAPDYREYLQSPLTSPLVAGQSYTVTFHVNLGDTCSIAINRLGAYLSVGPVGPVPNSAPLPYTPQVESPVNVFLTDTLNWVAITGTFVASGGEDHIVIGNFHDDGGTSTVPTGNVWPGRAYYMVDDVSVELAAPTLEGCCTSDGQCSMQYPGECTLLGGTPLGPGSACTGGPCGATPAARGTWGGLKILYR